MKTKLIMLAIALIAICSCSKENSNTEPANDNAELLISVWSENNPSSYKKNASIAIGGDGKCRYSYTIIGVYDDSEYRSYDLIYTYNKPNITFKYSTGEMFGEGYIDDKEGGGINDKIMYLGDTGTFTCYCFDGVYDFLND